MTPGSFSYEFLSAAAICVAWLMALPLGVALTSNLAVVQINSDNAGSPRI
jgi:hypothetical protein